MRKFKKTCNSPNFKHPDFWELVRSIGMPLSLIHDGEVESDVSERGARRVSFPHCVVIAHGLIHFVQFIEQ